MQSNEYREYDITIKDVKTGEVLHVEKMTANLRLATVDTETIWRDTVVKHPGFNTTTYNLFIAGSFTDKFTYSNGDVSIHRPARTVV